MIFWGAEQKFILPPPHKFCVGSLRLGTASSSRDDKAYKLNNYAHYIRMIWQVGEDITLRLALCKDSSFLENTFIF